jgi:hypothetical protein
MLSRPRPAGGAQKARAPALTAPARPLPTVLAWPEKRRGVWLAGRTGGAPAGRGAALWPRGSERLARPQPGAAGAAPPMLAATSAIPTTPIPAADNHAQALRGNDRLRQPRQPFSHDAAA